MIVSLYTILFALFDASYVVLLSFDNTLLILLMFVNNLNFLYRNILIDIIYLLFHIVSTVSIVSIFEYIIKYTVLDVLNVYTK